MERTFSCFDNYRRLCRNYELTFDSAEEMVKRASIRMLLNKIQTGSKYIMLSLTKLSGTQLVIFR